MVGLGTQDSAGEARDFVERYGTTSFPVFWDETFETWTAFGIAGQPAMVLLGGDGEVLGGWIGGFPQTEILALAAQSSVG